MPENQNVSSELEEELGKYSKLIHRAVITLILLFLYFVVYPVAFELFEDEISRVIPPWAVGMIDASFEPI